MSSFSEESLKHLGQLCRLAVPDERLEELTSHLQEVLTYVEQLAEADGDDFTPYSHLDEQGVDSLRDDAPRSTLTRETFLANAPDQVGGMIRVPPVFRPHD